MALKQLNFAGLQELDAGMLAAAVNEAMANAVQDMKNRIIVTGNRQITIDIFLKPVAVDRAGTLEQVKITYGLKEKWPVRKSAETVCGVKHSGMLYFNELSPNNPDQRTIDELEH